MLFCKKHLAKIGGLLIILVSLSIGGFSAGKDNAGTVSSASRPEQSQSLNDSETRSAPGPDQSPGGQPDKYRGLRPDSPQGVPGGDRLGGAVAGSTACSPWLLTYAALFLGLSIAVYYLQAFREIKIKPGWLKPMIIILLGTGLLLRIYAAALISGHPYDMNIFKNWAAAAANNLFAVYASQRSVDYPPLYMYILYFVGKLGSLPALADNYTLLLKFPSILADLVTSCIIYRMARRHLSPEMGIMLAAFYIFNPAVFIDSALWGQVDSLFTLIVAGAVYALAEARIGSASVLFMGAVMMKPQGIIFLPVLFFELWRQKNIKNCIKAVVCAMAAAITIVLPFAVHHDGLWIFRLFASTIGKYPYASVNAFNLFSLLGANYRSDSVTLFIFDYKTWGMIFIVLVTAWAWLVYSRRKRTDFVPAAALFLITGVFTIASGMHERYLYPAVALAIMAFIYLKDKRLLILAIGFSTTVYLNIHAVLFATMQGIRTIPYNTMLVAVSSLNVLLLVYLGKVLFDLAASHSSREVRVINDAVK